MPKLLGLPEVFWILARNRKSLRGGSLEKVTKCFLSTTRQQACSNRAPFPVFRVSDPFSIANINLGCTLWLPLQPFLLLLIYKQGREGKRQEWNCRKRRSTGDTRKIPVTLGGWRKLKNKKKINVHGDVFGAGSGDRARWAKTSAGQGWETSDRVN